MLAGVILLGVIALIVCWPSGRCTHEHTTLKCIRASNDRWGTSGVVEWTEEVCDYCGRVI